MLRPEPLKCIFAAAILGASLLAQPASSQDDSLHLIVLGDMPYGPPEEVYPPYEALIEAINARAPDLVIHVGDTKGGGACTNTLLDEQLAYMNAFDAPVLYTPGDNEWTDCHRYAGEWDNPLDRLDYIRNTYFNEPDKSLGKTSLSLMHQGGEGYPENARFHVGGIGFISAHIVGSNNGFEPREMAAIDEFFSRSLASTRWIEQSFGMFASSEMIVLAIHADMFEFDFNMFGNEVWLRHSGIGQFGMALKRLASDFDKPVLLLFGDSHRHRVFNSFPKTAPNITGIEVYGYPDMDAIEITLNSSAVPPFRVETIRNPLLE